MNAYAGCRGHMVRRRGYRRPAVVLGAVAEVPQATIRRSTTLQEAIQSSDAASKVSITLPRGVLQDWLQSVDA